MLGQYLFIYLFFFCKKKKNNQDIPQERITDTTWWMMVFLPYATVNRINSPEKVYEMLPWLLDKPLESCLEETYDDPARYRNRTKRRGAGH